MIVFDNKHYHNKHHLTTSLLMKAVEHKGPYDEEMLEHLYVAYTRVLSKGYPSDRPMKYKVWKRAAFRRGLKK